ncbi:hypothetical protein MLD38_011374 [Melastoma candidum]|uniref:Uncharacterized protein n=1 Tax=Melastoma candidum TaxID=119954 RepID=A0ACB9R2W2_9MYRT|nr:hypothetical protein MLD38_011374 [Melastoma candidum]
MFRRGITGAFHSSATEVKAAEEIPDLALARMRQSMEKLGLSNQEFSDATLMRFLIARSMVVEKATEMIVKWREWREVLVPNGFISESEVADELEARKIYLQGLTRRGHPLLIGKTCRHYPSVDKIQFKKFIAYVLDKTIACSFRGQEVGNEKMVVLLDLKDISFKNVDPRGLITGFQFLQSYYPEHLDRCYIVHMPVFFISVWKFVSRFLDKATLEKIVILTTEEEHEDLVEQIGDVLPEEYGGKAKLVAIQDVTLGSSL